MTLSDEANILRHHPLGETGIIVVADTAQHGVIHVAAKSARKTNSPFFGKIDLFFRVSLTWVPGRKSSLGTLREIKLLDPRENIRKSYLNTLMGAYFSKLLEKSTEPDSPIPEFHHLMERALDYLNQKTPDMKALLHFEKELAQLHGINSPSLDAKESLKKFMGQLPSQRDSLIRQLNTP